jgi:hypothetical protein
VISSSIGLGWIVDAERLRVPSFLSFLGDMLLLVKIFPDQFSHNSCRGFASFINSLGRLLRLCG